MRRKAHANLAAVLHEKGAIVDDTALEESLDDEFFLLKLSVHLNDTVLQEVELVGVGACLLQLSTLDHGLSV